MKKLFSSYFVALLLVLVMALSSLSAFAQEPAAEPEQTVTAPEETATPAESAEAEESAPAESAEAEESTAAETVPAAVIVPIQGIKAPCKVIITLNAVKKLDVSLITGDGKLTYTSSNKKVATVTSDGKVKAVAIGKATITVTAKATKKYPEATKEIKVIVVPKSTKISSLVASKKHYITVKWPTVPKTSGYIVCYSTDKDFTDAQYVKTFKGTARKLTIKDTVKGTKYYVKIATFKCVDGKKFYSKWSKVRTVTAK